MKSEVPAADTLARIAAIARGDDRVAAIRLAIEALRSGVRHPLVWGLVAEGLEAQNRRPEAIGLLRMAATATPGDARIWLRLGRLLLSVDQRAEAREALERGLAIAQDDYRGHIDAGTTCLRLGDLPAAKSFFRRASEIDPGVAEPLSALAVVAGLDGDADEARDLGLRALALDPGLISAQIAVARSDALRGAATSAAERLTALLARTDLSDAQKIDAHDLRAECLDTLDRPAGAFADYLARNGVMRRVNAPRFADGAEERQVDRVRRLAAWFGSTAADPWRAGAGRDEVGARATRRHVFLIGFPRSGTTLLEKVLASHPDIVTMEEIDALGSAGAPLLHTNEALARLATLSATEANGFRRTYWRAVSDTLGAPIAGRVFVDKMPLHTPALPLIGKLFPDARILFAVRDPRDVVLSCCRRRFHINAAMFEFLTLDGAAAFYNGVMSLAAIYRDRLPLRVHEVRHEAVVADFDSEVRRVLDFIGAPWSAQVRDFTAQVGGVPRTPSARQVARGLNADGLGQWRRYRAELAPVLPVLAPWVERFGYDPE